MSSPFLAHSENEDGNPHTLREHLLGVCSRVETFTRVPAHAGLLRLAALLHDLGKYRDEFQTYLTRGGTRGSVPHACYGAMLARACKAEDVSFVIDGHHAGLPNHTDWATVHTFATAETQKTVMDLYARFSADTGLQRADISALCRRESASPREKDMRIRYLFSCLTDADWLDTEAHFSPDKAARRVPQRLDPAAAIALVDAALHQLETASTPLNALRTRTRVQALRKAHLPVGFFSLNLPTGLGKTLTSFRWALEHAQAHALERIIIVLPYTSIIDQTAACLASILGQDAVLEHHSGIMPNEHDEQMDYKKLACENWDAPVIITTSVQFFETLFSNAPGKCRKLHNISQSVVILDEVQTLPKPLVLPTLDMLQDVHHALRTSFVFCTATMPAFDARPGFPGLTACTPLADDVPALFAATRRVRYALLDELRPVERDRLEDALRASTDSTLVIANTKGLVRGLYEAAGQWPGWDAVYHLSTGMCPHHRKAVLASVVADSRNPHKKILVVATQLVEAGVDVDFPTVYRELAPLESVIQAAGRCNREGKRPELGRVVLFQLKDGKYPDSLYQTLARHVSGMLAAGVAGLDDHATFDAYYQQVMGLFVTPEPVTAQREQHNFATVADQYRLIKSATQPVFIWDYNEDSRALYETLRTREKGKIPLSRREFRVMQQYSVQLYDSDLRKTRGSWEQSLLGVLVWNGGYNAHTGINITPQQADALIV